MEQYAELDNKQRQCWTTSEGQPKCQSSKYKGMHWVPSPHSKCQSWPATDHQRWRATKLRNTHAPLAPLDTGVEGRDSERLSFRSVSGASVRSGSRGSRGRDPIPLTPEILHLLYRLEPNKRKHARMLIEHLTGQRQLPATEQELHAQLDKRA